MIWYNRPGPNCHYQIGGYESLEGTVENIINAYSFIESKYYQMVVQKRLKCGRTGLLQVCRIEESYKNIDIGYFCGQSPIHQYYITI